MIVVEPDVSRQTDILGRKAFLDNMHTLLAYKLKR